MVPRRASAGSCVACRQLNRLAAVVRPPSENALDAGEPHARGKGAHEARQRQAGRSVDVLSLSRVMLMLRDAEHVRPTTILLNEWPRVGQFVLEKVRAAEAEHATSDGPQAMEGVLPIR